MIRAGQDGERTIVESLDPEFEILLSDFRASSSIHVATDLLGAAYVTDQTEAASEAARFIIERADQAPAVALNLAHSVLEQPTEAAFLAEPPRVGEEARKERIRDLRRTLRSSPRNPLAWLDLAREQAILAQPKAARRPIEIARALAPTSRLVLRTASRYLLHAGRREEAHDVLRRAPNVGGDPWLLAAEIAASSAAGRTSRFVKHARRVMASGDWSEFDTSELAAALGTLEASAGSSRKAKRLLESALLHPTENAVAQCAWVIRRSSLHSIHVEAEHLQAPRSYEARAAEHMAQGRYQQSVDAAVNWLLDEPFASRPAMHGSFVSSMILGDYGKAFDFALEGLRANPNDPILLNNAAFALASSDDTLMAATYLERLGRQHLEPELEPMYLATSGLLAYRTGDQLTGRSQYRRAFKIARENESYSQAVWALLFLAREEDRLDPGGGMHIREEVRPLLPRLGPVQRAVSEVLISMQDPDLP